MSRDVLADILSDTLNIVQLSRNVLHSLYRVCTGVYAFEMEVEFLESDKSCTTSSSAPPAPLKRHNLN